MANTIKLKRGSGSDPGTSDLSVGELAIRTDTALLFTKNDGGSVVPIGISDGDKGDITVSSNGGTFTIDSGVVTSAKIANDTIVNADINSSAAIDGSKISPAFTSDITGTGNLTLTSTDAGSSAAPEFELYRNSSSPADSDYLGQLKFTGESDDGSKEVYAKITGKISDASSGTEDGIIEFAHRKAGSNVITARFTSTAFKLINGTELEAEGGATVTGNIAVSGTVDGRDVAADGTKLDGIASNAIANVVEDTSPQLGGDLDVQSSKITTATSNGNVKIEPNGTGVVEVRGAGGNDGKLQLNCSAQSHGIKLASPAHSAGQSYTLIFPDNQIAADKYLKIKSISGSGSTAIGQAEYASLDANDLGEGTVPDARFPSTLPALNGSALTDLNGSNIASGTIAAARVATLNQDTTGNAATATALETARTIAGVSFDGTSNISLNNNAITNGAGYITATLTNEQVQDIVGGMLTGNTETGITVTYQDGDGTIDFVVGTLNQDTTGNAATATALETARNIGGVSFDGTANINLPGVNTSGSQDTSGTAAIATTVTVADESSDTTCFPLFATAATGNLAPKSGSNLAFNSSNGTLTATAFSGDGSALTGISAGATGGGSDEIFYENGQNVTTDYTITNGKNAMSAGPITIDSGVTVTVGAGETLTIV